MHPPDTRLSSESRLSVALGARSALLVSAATLLSWWHSCRAYRSDRSAHAADFLVAKGNSGSFDLLGLGNVSLLARPHNCNQNVTERTAKTGADKHSHCESHNDATSYCAPSRYFNALPPKLIQNYQQMPNNR